MRTTIALTHTIALVSITMIVGPTALRLASAAEEPPAQAQSATEALEGGKLLLNLRPRYEHVEQDGKAHNADAMTMRTLLGWRTKPWHDFSVTAEGINVTHFDNQGYNDLPARAAASTYPTIADPDYTGINQLYAQWTGLPKTDVKVGWQSIKLDNVRFIGNVEFRQVMQVFDAVGIENKSIKNLNVYAGYLWRQRNIVGDQIGMQMPVVNLRYTWKPGNDVIAYGYFQDQTNTGQNATTGLKDGSNKIYGVRTNGGYPIGQEWKLLYTAEYAKQDNYSGSDAVIDAHYYHAMIGGQWKDTFLRVHQELLSSNDGKYGFQTPLGTNHLFQGWVDKFLITPKNGIRDTYMSGGTKVQKLQIYAEYHKFRTDWQNLDLGNEFDIGLTYPLYKGLTGKLEYGDYRGGDPTAGGAVNTRDTRKLWVTVIYQY